MIFDKNAPQLRDLQKCQDFKILQDKWTNGRNHIFANGEEFVPKRKWTDKGNGCGYFVYIELRKYGWFEALGNHE